MRRNAGHPYTGRRFRKALRYFVVGRAAQAIASVAFLLLAIRLLPPGDYGTYMVILGIVEICRPLSSLGLLPAVQQYLPEMAIHASPGQLRHFVRWTTAARFAALAAFGALLYLLWTPLAHWLQFESVDPAHAWLASVLVVTLIGAGFTENILEALLEQRFAQLIRALSPIGRLLGLFALSIAGEATLARMLWIDIVVSAFCLLLAELALLRQLSRLRPDGSRRFDYREILTFAWHLSGAQVLNAAASSGTLRVVVAAALGVSSAGQFAFLHQLLTHVKRFLPSLLFVNLLRPMLIAANVQDRRNDMAAAASLLWKSNALTVLPVVGVLAVGGDAIGSMLSGGRVMGEGLALTLLATATMFASQIQISSTILQVLRHSKAVRSLSVLALLSPALVYVGSAWAIAGAAAGLTASSWLRSWLTLRLVTSCEPWLHRDAAGTLRAVAAVILAVAVAWPSREPFGSVVAAAAVPVIYLSALFLFRPLSMTDSHIVLRAFEGRFRSHLQRLLTVLSRRVGH